MYHFIPINGSLFPWAVSSPCYLSAFSEPIYSWAHFQHSFTYGSLLSFSACGPNSARGYSRPVCDPLICWAIFIALWNTAYWWPVMVGPWTDDSNSSLFTAIMRSVWPMFGQSIIRPIEGPLFLRPVEGPLFLWPVQGPLFIRPVGGLVSQMGYCGLWLLWPSFKK